MERADRDGDISVKTRIQDKLGLELSKILNNRSSGERSTSDHVYHPVTVSEVVSCVEEHHQNWRRLDFDTYVKDGSIEGEMTVLHLAAKYGHKDIVEWLVKECCADVNVVTSGYRSTPLHLACEGGHLDVAKWLVLKGRADINAVTDFRDTALVRACSHDRKNVAEWLVRTVPPDTLYRSNTLFGYTALHIACGRGMTDVVDVMLKRLLNETTSVNAWTTVNDFIRQKDRNGDTAHDEAMKNNYSRCAKLIDQALRLNSLFKHGHVMSRLSKLYVCGFERVGKSTLARTLTDKAPPTGSTRGFDVIQAPIKHTGEDPWALVDFGGEVHYYVTHRCIMDTKQTVFVLVCDLTKTFARQKQDAEYWLKFIATRVLMGQTTAHEKPKVIVVGSKLDKVLDARMSQHNEDTMTAMHHVTKLWEQLLMHCRTNMDLHPVIEITSDNKLLIDCRRPEHTSPWNTTMDLRATLCNARSEPEKVPRLCHDLKALIPTLIKRVGRITTTDAIHEIIQSEPALRFEGDEQWQLTEILASLDFTEDVIYLGRRREGFGNQLLEKYMILAPQWFGIKVLGSVIDPDWLETDMFVEGSITITKLSDFPCFKGMTTNEVDFVIDVLKHMDLCLDSKDTDEKQGVPFKERTLTFPCMMRNHDASKKPFPWMRVSNQECSHQICMGARLQVDKKQFMIPQGFFSRVQVRLKRQSQSCACMCHNVTLSFQRISCTSEDGLVECEVNLATEEESCTYIDVCVRSLHPLDGHREQCHIMLEDLVSACTQEQREHESVFLERYALQCFSLKEGRCEVSGRMIDLRRMLDTGLEHGRSLLSIYHKSERVMHTIGHSLPDPDACYNSRNGLWSLDHKISGPFPVGNERVEIWYTTDGSVPVRTSEYAHQYMKPISVDRTCTQIRLRTFFASACPSNVVTVTISADSRRSPIQRLRNGIRRLRRSRKDRANEERSVGDEESAPRTSRSDFGDQRAYSVTTAGQKHKSMPSSAGTTRVVDGGSSLCLGNMDFLDVSTVRKAYNTVKQEIRSIPLNILKILASNNGLEPYLVAVETYKEDLIALLEANGILSKEQGSQHTELRQWLLECGMRDSAPVLGAINTLDSILGR